MAKRTYSTAYGKNRQAVAQSQVRAKRLGYGFAGVAALGAAAGVMAGDPISASLSGQAAIGAFVAARSLKKKAQGSRAKAFAIDHLVQHGRRRAGSGKRSDIGTGGIGVVKGHYRQDARSGKSVFVREHARKGHTYA